MLDFSKRSQRTPGDADEPLCDVGFSFFLSLQRVGMEFLEKCEVERLEEKRDARGFNAGKVLELGREN